MLKKTKELSEAEAELSSLSLEKDAWRIGIRRQESLWRVIIQIDQLPYDILTGGGYSCIESAYQAANDLAISLGGVPKQGVN